MGQMRKMPTKKAIKAFWEKEMIRIGKFSDADDYYLEDACFACGFDNGGVERAHIHARIEGGPDTVENLHLLCHVCHKQSESLSGEAYWSWFRQQNIMHVALYAAAQRGVSAQGLMRSIHQLLVKADV